MKHAVVAFCLGLALASSVWGQGTLRDLSTPGFRVTLDKAGALRIWYGDFAIVTGASFSVAGKDWSGNLYPGRNPVFDVAVGPEQDGRKLTCARTVKGKAKHTATIHLSEARLRIINEFSVEADFGAGFLYSECFLARDTFDGAGFTTDSGVSGTLTVGGSATYATGLKQLELTTELGVLRVKVTASFTVGEAEKTQAWEFRSVCDRKWGADDRKTFSLMNVYPCTESASVRGRTEYEFTFVPGPGFAAKVAERRARIEAVRAAQMQEWAHAESARRGRIQANGGVVLYPEPQRFVRLPGEFVVTSNTVIVVPDGAEGVFLRAAERLQEELTEYRGIGLKLIRESEWNPRRSAILIGTRTASPGLAEVFAGAQVASDQAEAFVLSVTSGRIAVAGSDPRGAWYGVQALLQLFRWDGSSLVVPCVRVGDWPDFAVRAMMLTLGSSTQMDFLRHTLRRVLPRQRVNMVFIGGASIGKVIWASHPEVAGPNAFSPEQIRELADLARENFIEPVPHVQGFGHTGPLGRARPDLLAPKAAGRSPCFDITRNDVRSFIFGLYADAIDAFQAKGYFHVGFDEARGLELICGDRTHAEVVAEHITAVHGWLKTRGLRMIMWADMLLDHETFRSSSAANSEAPHYGNVNTAPALEVIPKDVLLANWYYGAAEEHPQIEHLQRAGFELFPTTWYKPENNFRLLRSSHQAGLTWAAGSSWMYCSATNPTMMGALFGEYAWTAGRPALELLNYDELALFCDVLQPPRVSDRPYREQHIDLSSVAKRSLVDSAPGDGKGWLDLGPEKDLSTLAPGVLKSQVHDRTFSFAIAGEQTARCVLVQGAKFGLDGVPKAVTVPVAGEGTALVFLHAGTADSCHTQVAGRYEIVYEDGTTEELVLRNSIDIAGWVKPPSYGNWRTARQQSYCRNCTLGWRGLTLGKRTVELSLTEWRNPKPTTRIHEIRLTAPSSEALALVGLTLLGPAR